MSDRPRGQVFAARARGRRVVVKLYDAAVAPVVRRTAALHHWLDASGIRVPQVVDRDLGLEAERERGRVALVLSWEGETTARGSEAMLTRAFENLARIHALETPALADRSIEGVTVEAGRPLEVAALRPAEEAFMGEPREFARRLAGPLYRVPEDALSRVVAWCEHARSLLDEAGHPDCLLHGDYRNTNLVEAPDGGLVTIDLDEALAGPFHRELGLALVRCVWGTTARALDRMTPRELLEHPRLAVAEDAYLASAPDAVRCFWQTHRETVLLAACLRVVGRLATRSAAKRRYRLPARASYRRSARRRFVGLARHLDAPAPHP